MPNSRSARWRPPVDAEARSATRSDNESTQPWIEESGAELVAVQERVVDRQALQQRNPSRGCRLHQRLK